MIESELSAAQYAGLAAGGALSGQVRFITRPKSRTMRVTRQLMLPPSNVT
jgi:hypothetical protein